MIDLSKIPRVSHDPPVSCPAVSTPDLHKDGLEVRAGCGKSQRCCGEKMVRSRSNAKKTHGNIWKNYEKFTESEDFKHDFLVGGLEHEFYFPFHIWDDPSH